MCSHQLQPLTVTQNLIVVCGNNSATFLTSHTQPLEKKQVRATATVAGKRCNTVGATQLQFCRGGKGKEVERETHPYILIGDSGEAFIFITL